MKLYAPLSNIDGASYVVHVNIGGFLWLSIFGSKMSVSVMSIVACISIFLDLVKNIHSPTCLSFVC